MSLLALALLAAGAQAQPAISPTWTLDSEPAGFGGATSNNTRGAAYNPVTDSLYVASRNVATKIIPVSAATGVAGTRSLNTTGVTGGTFNLNLIGISDDGQIFAANLSTTATGNFKIYRWSNPADRSVAPVAIFDGLSGLGRTGDSFAVTGAGDDIRIYASGSAATGIAMWTYTTSTGTLSAPATIPVASGVARGGIARSANPANLWVNGSGTTTREINGTTGALVREIPGTLSTGGYYTVETFSAGGRNYVVAGVRSPELDADVIDVTGTPFIAARLTRFGTNTNPNATGSVAVDRATGRIFLYGTNIGAAAYNTAPFLAPSLTITGPAAWHMLAVPGTGRTLDDLVGPLWTQGFPGADNSTGTPNVLLYDETLPGDFQQGFVAPGSQTDPLPAGQGRFVYVYEDDDQDTPGTQGGFPKVLVPGGPPASAPFTFALSYTDTGSAANDGWNLLGNPFAQALDWDGVTIGAGVDAAVYVYDPSFNGGSYRTYSGGVGNIPDGILARGQGFWVHATAPGASLVAPPAALATGGTLYRSATLAATQALRFELREGGVAGSETFVAVASGGGLGLDAYDAYALDPIREDFLRLATQPAAEAVRLAIQALPDVLDGEVRLPLAAEAVGGQTGARTLTLAWDPAALPDGWAATLRDTQTGQSASLAEAGTLAFETVAEAGRTADALALPLRAISRGTDDARTTAPRFEIVLTAGIVANEGGPTAALALAASPNPTRGTATVSFTLAEASDVSVGVYDALGRQVAVAFDGLAPAGQTRVSVPAGLAPGIYVVRLLAGDTAASVRLVVAR